LPARLLALTPPERIDAAIAELGKLVLIIRAWRAAPADPELRREVIGAETREEVLAIYQLRIADVTIGQDDFVLSNDLQVTESTADEALDYYVRFTSLDGTTLTLDGNQLFALTSFSFGATKPLDGIQPSGNVALNALQLSFGDAALNPSLLAQLASGAAFTRRPSALMLTSRTSCSRNASSTTLCLANISAVPVARCARTEASRSSCMESSRAATRATSPC